MMTTMMTTTTIPMMPPLFDYFSRGDTDTREVEQKVRIVSCNAAAGGVPVTVGRLQSSAVPCRHLITNE
jgi:hypothetical protein